MERTLAQISLHAGACATVLRPDAVEGDVEPVELVERIDQTFPAVHHFAAGKARNADLANAVPSLIGGLHVHHKIVHGPIHGHFAASSPSLR
jgi:hypothetical protein